MQVHYFKELYQECSQSFSQDFDQFKNSVLDNKTNFFNIHEDESILDSCLDIFHQFKDRKNFVHVGVGGSSLGAEMLVEALKNEEDREFYFFDNSDPDNIHYALEKIDPTETLFYIVSKSGGTLETMAIFSIISNWLMDKGINQDHFKNYFVFSTDPSESSLLDLGEELKINCLEIPSSIGGRFSIFSSVGVLPLVFLGQNPKDFFLGCAKEKESVLNDQLEQNQLFKTAYILMQLKKTGHTQTVFMPYSSKLKNLSHWFVQLWAESLGKRKNLNKEIVFEGLTPLASYGATHQHSQLQLFIEGPKDKLVFFIGINNYRHDFSLKNSFKHPTLEFLSHHQLSDLINAQLKGTIESFKEYERPYIHIEIDKITTESLGRLTFFFSSLTVLMGQLMKINPYNQPGVEQSKRHTRELLEKNV